MDETKIKLCKCGCGETVKEGKEFVQGHYSRWAKKQPKPGHLPKEEAPQKIVVTDVQRATERIAFGLYPWFEDENGNKYHKDYDFIGIHDDLPCVLLMTVYGRLVPVYLIPGFIGMYPIDMVFPEPAPQNEAEQKKEIPVSIAPEEDKPPHIQDNEPIITEIHAQEQKKQSLLARILGTKDEAKEKGKTTSDIAREIIEKQGVKA